MHQFPYELYVHQFHSPLELVYSNVWGSTPVISRFGFRYYVCFIDANSRYNCIHLLANNSQFFQASQQYKAVMEKDTSCMIKVLQIDNVKIIFVISSCNIPKNSAYD